MASQNDNGMATFAVDAPMSAWRRVKLSSTTNRTVTYADAGEVAIGVTQEVVEGTGDQIQVKTGTTPGTFKVEAAKAIATRNCALYGANDGKVSDAASGGIIGYALDTASGTGAVLEMAPIADLPTTEASAVAVIDDDSGGTTSGTEQIAVVAALTCLAAIDNDSGGTDSGTEQLAAVGALTCLAAIDDDSGGTNAGTEQLAAVGALTCLAAIDDDCGGTNSGTEQLGVLKFTAGSAGFRTPIINNLAVLADQCNRLRVDVDAIRTRLMNGFAVLADEHNKLRVDAAALRTRLMNSQTVLAKEHNKLRVDVNAMRTREMNSDKVFSTQINHIITALQGAGFMAT